MLIRTENVDEDMSLCPGVTIEIGDVEDKPRKLLEDSEGAIKVCTVLFDAYDS